MQLMTTSSTPTPAASARPELRLATLNVVKVLFMQFPQLAASAVDQRAMVDVWAVGLADMRVTEIERGLAATRGLRFPPSLGEFAQLCRPALDPEIAYWEAERGLAERRQGRDGQWSHPAVFRAATQMSDAVSAGDYRRCRRQWEFVLARELDAGWGEGVPEAPKQIEQQERGYDAPSQEVRRKLAALQREFKETL